MAASLRPALELGAAKLSAVTQQQLQSIAEGLLASGLNPSTVRNALMPARVIFRRAMKRGEIAINPTAGLELPAVRGRRDRVAGPHEARQLIAALTPDDRAVWATAFYAGLRLGELRALVWSDVDLASGVIRVTRSWDAKAGPIAPKSSSGTRNVPIGSGLRDFLVEHKMITLRSEGLVFGRSPDRPFEPATVNARAYRCWQEQRLSRITMHEARHTYASLMIAAGVNAMALSVYMGHANISITLDRYGHLMPGAEGEAANLLDRYLAAPERPIDPMSDGLAAGEALNRDTP